MYMNSPESFVSSCHLLVDHCNAVSGKPVHCCDHKQAAESSLAPSFLCFSDKDAGGGKGLFLTLLSLLSYCLHDRF